MSHPVLRWFLLGTIRAIPLGHLRNEAHLLEQILDMTGWHPLIHWERSVHLVSEGVSWPEPTGVCVNMLPIIVGNPGTLPAECIQYHELIKLCKPTDSIGQIGYLTIQEGMVEADSSQRRPGIHTDKSAMCLRCGTKDPNRYWTHAWGMGRVYEGMYSGGIFMASNISDSCKVWDAKVPEPGLGGDVEYLRGMLGDGISLDGNGLYWITDETPHESVPLATSKYRQFFRLVTGQVGAWFEEHSDPNPLVRLPENVKRIAGNKFTMFAAEDPDQSDAGS
eukprot:TRINITY_DN18760_c0_g1_i2.p1 TRINITY_DN18760_c0_g1~~TRINITY_DN18760_c0_g1_i2.p1  ORF type:complete len:278 (-),score=34.68 TRINITY_DN18760_c0_g1_i2:344-1177(-)